jgi:hypothetical protein
VLVIKLKKEWRKVRKRARERRKTWDRDKKGKDGFQDGGMGEVDASFAGDIQGTEATSRGVRKRTEQQGLGGSGQNALEKMKEIENKY